MQYYYKFRSSLKKKILAGLKYIDWLRAWSDCSAVLCFADILIMLCENHKDHRHPTRLWEGLDRQKQFKWWSCGTSMYHPVSWAKWTLLCPTSELTAPQGVCQSHPWDRMRKRMFKNFHQGSNPLIEPRTSNHHLQDLKRITNAKFSHLKSKRAMKFVVSLGWHQLQQRCHLGEKVRKTQSRSCLFCLDVEQPNPPCPAWWNNSQQCQVTKWEPKVCLSTPICTDTMQTRLRRQQVAFLDFQMLQDKPLGGISDLVSCTQSEWELWALLEEWKEKKR